MKMEHIQIDLKTLGPQPGSVILSIGAKMMLWVSATLMLTIVAAILFHPAVFLGTIIGVTTTTLKNMHSGL